MAKKNSISANNNGNDKQYNKNKNNGDNKKTNDSNGSHNSRKQKQQVSNEIFRREI